MDSAEEDHHLGLGLGLDEEEEDEDGDESGGGEADNDLPLLHSTKSDQQQLLLLELHPHQEEEVADNLFVQPNSAQSQVTMDSTTPSDLNRQTLTTIDGEEKVKPLAMLDESQRRLFQRLWTDEDEIQLLQGFLNYSSQRGFTIGNSWSNHQDTTMFYDQVRGKLQLDFNKNQLVRKLRRMKKKYRTVESKIRSGRKDYCFKSPHDQATFEISRRIWRENDDVLCSNGRLENDQLHRHINNGHEKRSRKRPRTSTVNIEDTSHAHAPIAATTPSQPQTQTQTTVASMVLNSLPFGLLNFTEIDKNTMDDKWRKQQILELEVYSKRLDLIQDQIKLALADLTSFGS